jgi:hypothetical protein
MIIEGNEPVARRKGLAVMGLKAGMRETALPLHKVLSYAAQSINLDTL